MITQSFPNPNKKNFPIVMGGSPWEAEWDKAKKMGLSPYEYSKRVAIVESAIETLDYKKGDVVYPHNATLFHKNGKAVVSAICYHYDHYGSVKWDDKLPMLVAAHWEDTPKEIFNCTIGYLQKAAPHGVKEE